MPELLAPADDADKLAVALLYGADAVYLGEISLGLMITASRMTKSRR